MLILITHRCEEPISPNGGWCEPEDRIPCPAVRLSNGQVRNSQQCGEPCNWIMGKAGYGRPPWELNKDGTRRNIMEADSDD